MYLAWLFKRFVVLSLAQQAWTEKLPVPVALYPLNGRHGTKDTGPNKNPPGIPSGVHFAPGPDGHPQGSYQFSGSINSYIEIPNHGGLNTRYSITFLAWVSRENEKGPIFSYGRATWGFHVWIVRNGHLYARSTDWPWPPDTWASPELSKSWHHVGVTYDFSSGVMRLWVNGEIGKEVNVGSVELRTQYEVRLGAKDNAIDQRYFKGRICCVQVYSKALSLQEIIAVQNRTVWETRDDHFHPVFPSQDKEQGVKVLAAFASSSVMECLLRCSRRSACNSVAIDGISKERSIGVHCQLYQVKFEDSLGLRDDRKDKQYYSKNDFVC